MKADEVLVGQGTARIVATCEVSITAETFYRWQKEYGCVGTQQLRERKWFQKDKPLSPPLVRAQY